MCSRTKLGQTTQLPKENNKRTNNDLQSTTQKTKDRATRTPLKSGCELSCIFIKNSVEFIEHRMYKLVTVQFVRK
jgi:hypothetical protein